MKKKGLALATAALLLCSCGQNSNLQGDISGIDTDTLLLYQTNAVTGKWVGIDTLTLQQGHFETQIGDSILLNIAITAKNKPGEKKAQVIGQSFLFFPGDQMTLTGTPPYEVTASGTTLYDLLAEDAKLTQKGKALNRLEKMLDEIEDEEAVDSLEKCYDQAEKELCAASLNFIKRHPDSRAAAYLSLNLDGKEGLEAVNTLSENMRNGVMKPIIDEYEDYYENAVETEKHRLDIQPGKAAPDFQLKDLDGKVRSLADFSGKYTVLDFWGTWCGWCLAGIPQMKVYAKKYADKVEFVGICCADTETQWKKCVEQRKMIWTQLFNGEADNVPTIYGVDGYPTKIIIDPEGKIKAVFEGESQEFYDWLDQNFG